MTNDVEYLHSLRAKFLSLWHLTEILEEMMADIAQIQADIDALKDAEVGAANELQHLADLVAQLKEQGASAVTDADLANLHDSIQSVTTGLVAATQGAQSTTGDQPQVNPLAQPGQEV